MSEGSEVEEAPIETWQRVADAGIRTLRIPTPFQVGRVNCYLLEDEPLTLIDAGPDSARALHEVERQLDALGHSIEQIELVIVTHQHLDHFGLAQVVADRAGAEVAAIDVVVPYLADFKTQAELDDRYAVELMRKHGIAEEVLSALLQVSGSFRAWGSEVEVTRPLRDGETLELGGRTLEVQHRPGHSASDTVFWDADRQILIAADHLIKHISSNALITRALDGSPQRPQSLVDYIRSLQRTLELPAEVVLAGHGEPIDEHRELITRRLAMHDARARKLYELIAEQPRSGHELAQELWGDVAVTSAFLTLSEVIGHVDLLINAGHVREAPMPGKEEDGAVRYEATAELKGSELGELLPGRS